MAFRDFEKCVIRHCCSSLLSEQALAALLSEDNRFSLEHTGSGYFLTTRNSTLSLPTRRLQDRSLIALSGEAGAGFVLYLHQQQLTLECFATTLNGLSTVFRDSQPVLENTPEREWAATDISPALSFRHRLIRLQMRLGIDRMLAALGLKSGPLMPGSLTTIRPVYLVGAVAVAAIVVLLRLSNPYRIYSSERYWEDASVADVSLVPAEALAPGNRNGSVLMWAAIASDDPAILEALVERGADANERDIMFSSTPLSGAAGFSDNPAIIDTLIRLGAEVDRVVGSEDRTPLTLAAELNENPAIIERLLFHGADATYRDKSGRTALQHAQLNGNEPAIRVLRGHLQQ